MMDRVGGGSSDGTVLLVIPNASCMIPAGAVSDSTSSKESGSGSPAGKVRLEGVMVAPG